MAEWWMQSGTTSTDVGANQPVMVGACAVLGIGAIGTAELGALSVTSEKASANLATRSVVVNVGSTFGLEWASTALPLWKAPAAVTLTNLNVMAVTPWIVTATTDVFTFWSCTAGVIGQYCSTSNTVLSAGGLCIPSCQFVYNCSTGLNLVACEVVRVALTRAANSCAQGASIQIDYVTSG